MRTLCVIPARGGSKGIPRKNLRRVAGRPLLVWTVEQALACRGELDVVVSTDDPEIAALAAQAGALVPFLRPAALATDTAASEPVVAHALGWWRGAHGGDPDAVLLLQPTSPVRLPGTLDRALAEYAASGADSMVGVVPQAPFLWRAGAPPRAEYDVTARPRRQDLATEQLRYRETGSVYLTRPWVYDELGSRVGGTVALFVMAEAEGVDVDTETDLAVAEAILNRLAGVPSGSGASGTHSGVSRAGTVP